ncbi:hypothetical protein TpMuguga_04g00403 [Theileria parva strain Muguga]|uniref:Uncharacterized protein n=1 Tax=Theileria parva TaxID=5875 RepID=Q4N2E6_THEPA|nr:uncharacterized protein TpMuguga_04g00403 [Theileria parva strain Muguga]EAN31755.1 hypothetical protein TpMuguga_04g00403 [Theileria parva strain Muguga]|eukprot:XP_764038.1 hypothetical protein [Theileria parva strain Muguga]
MFEFEEPYRNNNKQLKLFNEDKTALLNDKPVGLHRTVLDLEFPERVGTSNTDRLYRIVQCLATGNVEYLQKKIYKSLKVKLTSRESFSDSAASCTNEVVLTLSPPGTISTDFHLTDHYKLHEKRVTLAKTQEKTVDFQDVLNDGLLDMELFWLNFEITGKCSKYLVVELLKPNNIDPLGNDCDPTSILVP